ncbi:hypothetical protein TIFTF001_026374 [Ficus carica]|uniref:2-oxoglutarate dehydrogenase, mitochondrial n=1 Tax=Ficus carica TaxID=3494 RepID=A0AA88DL43_FICCA|nr:hypothetical protein TIFTF001_026374 [Ficus carica]
MYMFLIERNVVHIVARTRVLPSQNRNFHTTIFKSKVQAAPVPHPVPLSRLTDSFLDGTNNVYLEELQRAWEADPNSIDESWDNFFRNFVGQAETSPGISGQTIHESMRLLLLVRAYQVSGHMKAKLDPLGLEEREISDDLDPAHYGFTEADLDREFFLGVWRMAGFLSENHSVQTLRSILTRLEQAYCGSIGYEYMHIADREKCNWLRDKIETPMPMQYNRQCHEDILDRLVWSTQFEKFLATKWHTHKRFGLEGGETLIPGMKEMFDRSADLGPLRQIFSEFSGDKKPVDEVGLCAGTGDVKYHLGTSYDQPTRGGKRIHLSLVANTSHFEAVDSVVLGKTRAKQYYLSDVDRTKNMGVLIHGDGSFAGQGVVFEILHLSALPNYTTGGTIHIVVNNQVAFTTDPRSGRSSQYCADVAKALDAPIFHVNGDDMEAVVHVCELAAEWRQTFHSDVVVDLVCYRRYGHNEMDEPSFTQPKMYEVIRNHPSALQIYQNKLLESGQVTREEIDIIHEKINSILNGESLVSKDYVPQRRDWLASHWTGFKSPEQISRVRNIGVKPEILKSVGKAITSLPDNFKPHSTVKRAYLQRAQMIETGEGIDWALAEALAFATLVVEGNHVRLSGQDVERGTFSHRHSVLHDQETGEKYCPLDHVIINQDEEMFTVSNSPNSLVIWEAQFGDFSNGAQFIFDQFISGGEAKWVRQTGLVVLLPHGYDGQGPEHSSARLERFLQMSDDDPFIIPEMDPTLCKQIQECNWLAVNVTTPANYFHVLRRQIHRGFRKPLIVMAPKNLLRHKDCKSNLPEFDDVEGHPGFDKQGTRFKRLIKDQNDHSDLEEGIRRLVLCSGKVYYELVKSAKRKKQRMLQYVGSNSFAPSHMTLFRENLSVIRVHAEIVWCQEEPMNMGAYSYIVPRLYTAMKSLQRGSMDDIKFVGRPPSAATATGFCPVHEEEQKQLRQKAIQPEPIEFP